MIVNLKGAESWPLVVALDDAIEARYERLDKRMSSMREKGLSIAEVRASQQNEYERIDVLKTIRDKALEAHGNERDRRMAKTHERIRVPCGDEVASMWWPKGW
tara:strand:+ start:1378 stop:1686 length:309 start_codon:yes stop_codon:yes gene_type:complete